jgi:hypothetical protein
MEYPKMPDMQEPVYSLPRDRRFTRGRDQRMSRAMEARRNLSSSGGRGRAWINGREVGGEDPRFAHLSRSFD